MKNFPVVVFLVFALPRAVHCQTAVDRQLMAAARQMENTTSAMNRSIARQRGAITWSRATMATRLAEAGTMASVPPEPSFEAAPASAGCAPLSPLELNDLATRAANRNEVDPALVLAVIHQESDANPCAVSSKGAMGLMQLMPATADQLNVQNPFDPAENVLAGSRVLRTLLQHYSGDLVRTLGAYNAGAARVDASGGLPPFPETISYVDSILGAMGISAEPR